MPGANPEKLVAEVLFLCESNPSDFEGEIPRLSFFRVSSLCFE